jgi:hypothetical protein
MSPYAKAVLPGLSLFFDEQISEALGAIFSELYPHLFASKLC